uniref:ADP-ribosylglycohydrolase n=1 Tax=Pyrodinium bahamense TaxID=73915 RepID=A0A7S0FH33_9DINO
MAAVKLHDGDDGAAGAAASAWSGAMGQLLDEIDQKRDRQLVAIGAAREDDLNGYSILQSVPLELKERLVREALQNPALDRVMGSMCGMAVGDSLGHLFEFQPVQDVPGSAYFDLATMKAHGASNAFCLQPGQWTDDAAMGLCMADSLIMRRRFDGSDMRIRFWCWWNRGYNNAFRKDPHRSSSVGLGGNIAKSLHAISHLRSGQEVPPTYDAASEDAGNGSLMRFTPVSLFLHGASVEEAHHLARLSSYTTHPGIIAAEACALLCHILVRALNLPPGGRADPKAFLETVTAEYLERSGLSQRSGWGYDQMKWLVTSRPEHATERCWNWKCETLDIAATLRARGSRYNGYPVSAGYFGSYSLDGLALALWSVYHTDSFDQAVTRSVNLLGDADSHGSITGQIAGAFYGYSTINPQFIKWLTKWDDHEFAVRALLLHHLGSTRTAEAMPDLPSAMK